MVTSGASPTPVVVVGLGLIGGSLAKMLVRREGSVIGWDPDPVTRAAAADEGVIVPASFADAVSTAKGLIVLAVPLRAVSQTMKAIAELVDSSVTITDVGSVKREVRAAALAAGLQDQFVGAHPMAGTELSGFTAARSDLLDGITWAVTITHSAKKQHVARVLRLITQTSRSRALVMTDQEHDEAVAQISHLPHVFATELLAIAGKEAIAAELAAGSFRDGTRVARHGAMRSQAMIEANSDACAALVRKASLDLAQLADDLETGQDIGWFFARSNQVNDNEREITAIRVPWVGSWQASLLAAGVAARAVTDLTDTHVTLEAS